MRNFNRFFAVSTVTLAAVLLTACGGGGGGDSKGSTGSAGSTGSTGSAGSGSTVTEPDVPVVTVPAVDGTLVATVNPSVYGSAEKKAAFDTLNAERSTCGFGALAQNSALDAAAQAHADWMVTNGFTHTETVGSAGFTGENPWNRAATAGYTSNQVAEGTAAYAPSAGAASGMRGLLSAPYHAMLLLNSHREVGLGLSSSLVAPVYGMLNVNVGSSADKPAQLLASDAVATYPCEGVTGTKFALRSETPSPVTGRDLATNPLGQPVVVMVRPGNTLRLSTVSMVNKATNAPVAMRAPVTKDNDPNASLLGTHQGYALPDLPLAPSTAYTVTVTGYNNNVEFTKTFSFTTGNVQ